MSSMSKKTLDDYFRDWFNEPFGYCYGTGEEPILQQLKAFVGSLQWSEYAESYIYDYKVLEDTLGKAVTWLLINALCKNNDIEYGSSPRNGWFYGPDRRLVDYIKAHSISEMYKVVADFSEEKRAYECFSDHCNCRDKQTNHRCRYNPFWNNEPLERP